MSILLQQTDNKPSGISLGTLTTTEAFPKGHYFLGLDSLASFQTFYDILTLTFGTLYKSFLYS